MEPFTALSLAASIAQFLEFGGKLISQTKKIADTRTSLDVEHFKNTTEDLLRITTGLEEQLEGSNRLVSKEEMALHDLTHQCHELAKDVSPYLKRLTLDPGKNSFQSSMTAARIAFKSIWDKDRLDNFARAFRDYREQLSLRVLLLLNAHNKLQDEKFQRSSKNIVEVVSFTSDSLHSLIDDRYERNVSWQRREQANAQERHAQVMAAILTTQDGQSRTITGIPDKAIDGPSLMSVSEEKATTYHQATRRDNQDNSASADFYINSQDEFSKRILDALHFRSIDERRSAISDAHKGTYNWIYADSAFRETRWDNFPQWLIRGSDCYWINGKAGSGKSTLMKYIEQDPRTREALQGWSQSSELVVASFFFWYAGTPLQKSQSGLLRSLLLAILSKRPELIAVVFPNLCRSLLSGQLTGKIELTLIELKAAFMTLVSSIPEGLSIFLLVDGIDEYEGDHDDLSALFSKASGHKRVKMLLSSRPISACVHAFDGFPKLRLQDLTYDDLSEYVQDVLCENRLMQNLETAHQGAAHQLMEEITLKADGVFLWVILVVRRLLGGLRDYDNLSDLLSKLDELPPDLEALYELMLGAMSRQHQRQGSKILQMVVRSLETHGAFPMTLLQLSFAEEDDYPSLVLCPPTPLPEQQLDWRCENTEGRLRSRCCGLIEVQESSYLEFTERCVMPYHRTVIEFLKTPSIWRNLVSLTARTRFDTDEALLASAIKELKYASQWSHRENINSPALHSMLRCLSYADHMRFFPELLFSAHLPALKELTSHMWFNSHLFNSPKEQLEAFTQAADRLSKQCKLSPADEFLLLALGQCPEEHASQLLESFYPLKFDQKSDEPSKLPWFSVRRSSHVKYNPFDSRVLLSVYLLTQFVDARNPSVRISVIRNVASCAEKVFEHGVRLPYPKPCLDDTSRDDAVSVSERSVRDLLADAYGKGFSLWEFALHYTNHLNNYAGEEFFHTKISLSFMHFLLRILRKNPTKIYFITSVAYDAHDILWTF